MLKKRLILPILLMSPFHSSCFNLMSEMMREMEESFERMHHMMEEVFNQPQTTSKHAAQLQQHLEELDDAVLFKLEQVAQGDIKAQFNDNILSIKHPEFILKITQIKNRYNQPMLSIEMRHEQTTAKDEEAEGEGKKQFFSSSMSSSIETRSINKAVEIDNPSISYDEDTKTLIISLPHKNGKQIPITVKRNEQPVTT